MDGAINGSSDLKTGACRAQTESGFESLSEFKGYTRARASRRKVIIHGEDRMKL